MTTRYSYSRISTFEQCPAQYRAKYVDRTEKTREKHRSGLVGSAVHAVAEDLVREHRHEGATGRLDYNRIPDLLSHQWAELGLPGDSETFREALGWLRRWAALEDEVDSSVVVGIEHEFTLDLDGAEIFGIMDRVDFDFGTLTVVDYKTSRALFSTEELDRNLQLSIYAMAALEEWPDALDVKLALYMFRHGVYQRTTRTDAQLEATRLYLAALIEGIEGATSWPARVNEFCSWCQYADQCDDYQAILSREPDGPDTSSVAVACRERQRLHVIEKAAATKKREAERVIKAALKNTHELSVDGVTFSTFVQNRTEYDVEAIVRVLASHTGETPAAIAGKICKTSRSAINGYLVSLALDPGLAMVLSEELDLLGEERATPRLSIRKERRA